MSDQPTDTKRMDPELKSRESKTRLYGVWMQMRLRCSNPTHPNFKDYGGRGITVCDEWRDNFAAFKRDMGERPQGTSIDRIDNNGPYSPLNCRWATNAEQRRNNRRTRMLTFQGKTLCMRDWERHLGFGYGTLLYRLNKLRMPVEEALTKPLKRELEARS